MSFILSAAVGYVTSVVTAHPSTGAWAALVALVVLGAGTAVAQGVPESRQKKPDASLPSPLALVTMPVEYAVIDPAPVFEAADVDHFIGRQWLVERLDEFMASNRCGYFLVEADAGMGKTAFAAWLVRTRGYLSHFSRLSGGRSTRNALQNLSAQLISKYGLAVELLVPEEVLSPGNFQTLLSRAAERLGDDGSLVIVVDGLDEARQVSGELPFGLPALLPRRVFVVATYRTGSTPRHVEPSQTVRIGRQDVGNVSDIRAYLAAAAGTEPLSSRCTAAGLSAAAFVDLLADRSEGVWVYLRYVLADCRAGTRSPGALEELPFGLGAYYGAQLDRWRQASDWAGELLPLLATLGVAGEPLTAATLALMAGVPDVGSVRRWCGTALRPLLSVTTAGDERLFEIYHASLREVLRGTVPSESDGLPLENAHELRTSNHAANSRIADRYIALFGGLGLVELGVDLRICLTDGGYPLRHLARHLRLAHRATDLSRLLLAERPTGADRAVNIWHAAQDGFGSAGHYLDDLYQARELAAESTDKRGVPHETAPSLGLDVTFALMAASILSRTKYVPPILVGRAVETGLWPPARSLDHARRMPGPRDRVETLVAVSPYLETEQRTSVLAEALSSALEIRDGTPRVSALTLVAAHLPSGHDQDVFRQALTVTATLTWTDMAASMSELAGQLPCDLMGEALSLANSQINRFDRVGALTALLPFLPREEQANAVRDVLALIDDHGRASYHGSAVGKLAPYLSANQLDEAVRIAMAVPESLLRAQALTALAPRVAATNRLRIVEEAMQAALETGRVAPLIALAPLLPPEQKHATMRGVLETAKSEHFSTCADILVAAGSALPPDLHAEALAVAMGIEFGATRSYALAGLLANLSADQQPVVLRKALDAAASAPWHMNDKALALLAPRLTPENLSQVLDEAIALPHPDNRVEALSALAPYLTRDLLERCLESVTISDDWKWVKALQTLAQFLHDDDQIAVQGTALRAAFAMPNAGNRREALKTLLLHLHPDLLDQALAHCRAQDGTEERARHLTLLSLGRAGKNNDLVAEEALAATRQVSDESNRADLLTALAHQLTGQRLAAVTQEVLDAVAAVDDSSTYRAAQDKASTLASLVNLAPSERKSEILSLALASAQAVDRDDDRIRALLALVPALPADGKNQVLQTVLQIALSDHASRPRQLELIAPALPPEMLARAYTSICLEQRHPGTLRDFAAVVPYLPTDQQHEFLRKFFSTAEPWTGYDLAAVAPVLPQDLVPVAVTMASALPSDASRIKALSAISDRVRGPERGSIFRDILQSLNAVTPQLSLENAWQDAAAHLPKELLAEAMKIAPKTSAKPAIALLSRAYEVLPPHGAEDHVRLLRSAFTDLDRLDCLDVLTASAKAIADLAGDTNTRACADGICDVERWWP